MSNNSLRQPLAAPTAGNVQMEEPATLTPSAPSKRRYVNSAACVVATGIALGLIMLKRSPQSAGASQAAPASSASFDQLIATELPAIRNVDVALANTDMTVEELKSAPASVQVPLMELKVNPFRQGGSGASANDAPEDSAAHDLREQERQSALQAVQSLRLESITHRGPDRACTINNVRYQEGQEADGFLVEEIASNIVVVRKGAYRFELKPSL